MKGVIFNLAEQVVTDAFGADLWDQVLDGAGLSGSYTSLGSYPDADLKALVASSANVLGVEPQVVVRTIGEGAIPLLAQRYPDFFSPHQTTRSFLLTLNDIIHPEVRKLYPGADVPEFDFAEEGEHVLLLTYRSHRQLCGLAEGFVTSEHALHLHHRGELSRQRLVALDEPATPESRLVRRLAREREIRLEAETIAERATSELYDTVQELTRANRLAELLGDIAVCANEASTVEEAMRSALDSICAFTGWKVGHALVRTEDGPARLVSLRVWSLPNDASVEPFRVLSEELEFGLDFGLPGRVLAQGQPDWIVDLAGDGNFPRGSAALECGLVSAFALPLLIRSETVGVLEFFSTSMHPPDEVLLRVAGFVGAQLGRVLERRIAEDRLRQLALYDTLTGLPNRALLMDRLHGTLLRCQQAGTAVDLLYLDIDDFKSINDSRGHSTGDEVLTAVGRCLLAVADGPTGTVARLAGDEFVVVLEDCADATAVAREIEKVLRQPLHLLEGEVFVSLSGGIAAGHLDLPDSPEQVLGRANLALHEAKRTGKGKILPFEPHMQEQALHRHALGEQLHRAVLGHEFTLVYQPVVRLKDERIIGAEALIRWQHPDLGLVMPDRFIPRAEETGLIVAIGAWVLGEACRQAQTWVQSYGEFTMAVNVSGRQLHEVDFPEMVQGALRTTGLEPHQLCLEMTESILMERDVRGIAMLTRLRDLGIHLAIDDFGTGYSSLGSLRQLPADLLKIDRSFVSGLPDDEDAATIAWAIVHLGHNLDMPVLAEGVETVEQRDALRAYACDEAQGYLFGRPMSADAMTDLLRARPRE